jgi:hypothetical protein
MIPATARVSGQARVAFWGRAGPQCLAQMPGAGMWEPTIAFLAAGQTRRERGICLP